MTQRPRSLSSVALEIRPNWLMLDQVDHIYAEEFTVEELKFLFMPYQPTPTHLPTAIFSHFSFNTPISPNYKDLASQGCSTRQVRLLGKFSFWLHCSMWSD